MDHLVKHIAVILARGGSKRLPRKNILEFHGKPLLAWSIEAALESACYQRILVSTDDPEIAEIAKKFGAEVPFLRHQAADDMAPSSEATLAALAQAESHWGERYDLVSQLMANCPLRNASNTREAVSHFLQRDVDFQISCFRYGWMNPWWAARVGQDQRPDFLFPVARSARSQDLPPLYCPTGALWIARSDALKSSKTFYGDATVFQQMDWMSAMDIDDLDDLQMAKACFLVRQENQGR
jgi:CMP-N-acetylneuraminic acid synthetase